MSRKRAGATLGLLSAVARVARGAAGTRVIVHVVRGRVALRALARSSVCDRAGGTVGA